MKTVIIVLLTILSVNAFTQDERKFVRKGNGLYNDGNYKQAEVEYRKALEKDPSSYKADYNLGNALYKQNQYDAAAGRYNSLIQNSQGGRNVNSHNQLQQDINTTEPETLSKYYYNLGNSLFHGQKFKESIEAYKMSLRINPEDLDAKHNLQLALSLMREEEKKNQQKGGNNQENNQDKKDQQNKDQQDQQQNQQEDKQQKDESQQKENEQQRENDQKRKQPEASKTITPEDAERILNALENEEKQTLREVQDSKERKEKMQVEKNW